MPGPPKIDFDADAADVYRAISALDDDTFADLMEDGEQRPRVIGALIGYMAGLFRPDKAEGIDAVIHIKLWDRPGGGYDHFEMRIADRACAVSEDPEREPDLTLKVRPTDLRAMINGKAGPRRLALKGRLRVIGDLGLGMKLPELFAFDA